MSYNILADQYAGTSYAQQVLFKYCPTQLLDNNYRRQLVLQEVLAYQVGLLLGTPCCCGVHGHSYDWGTGVDWHLRTTPAVHVQFVPVGWTPPIHACLDPTA
jgi:hypothetical protein